MGEQAVLAERHLMETVGTDIVETYRKETEPNVDIGEVLDSHGLTSRDGLAGKRREIMWGFAGELSDVCKRNHDALRDLEPTPSTRNLFTFLGTGISGNIVGGLCAYAVAYLSNASPEIMGHAAAAGAIIGGSVAYTLELLYSPARTFVSRIAYGLGYRASEKKAMTLLTNLVGNAA